MQDKSSSETPRRGRPRDASNPPVRSMIRHNPEDMAHWKKCAASLGLTFSQWARMTLNTASGRGHVL